MKHLKLEWPTLGLIILCYIGWIISTWNYQVIAETYGGFFAVFVLIAITALLTAFHTSLQHEIVHGHPTTEVWFNEALVFLPLILVYPYQRYRDLHLTHHINENLTDPYDDPESYYWPQCDGHKLSKRMRFVLGLNNTLAGRLILGPVLGLYGFYRTEWMKISAGETGVRKAWILHMVGLGIVLYWVAFFCQIPIWLYLCTVVYPAMSWILIRSFAEHRASESIGGRSAIVDSHPFFAILYLNNNLHLVHHVHPSLPWYELPAFYRERRENYLAANDHYFFSGYWEVFKRYAFKRKQPVFHPLWRLLKPTLPRENPTKQSPVK